MLIATENFKNKDKSEFKLNILVNENEIIAIAENNISKEIEAFDKVGNITDLSLNQHTFSDTQVLLINSQFTLIPESVFNEDDAASYLNFSTETIEPSDIIVSKNKQFSLNTIWHLNTELKKKITQYWPGCTFSHLIAHRLNNTAESNAENTLFVDVLKGSITIILFTDQELQVANQFEVNGDEDALYYLLLTLEQSKIKVEDLNVILSSTESFKEKLNKYFKKTTMTTPKKCSLKITEEDKVSCSIL